MPVLCPACQTDEDIELTDDGRLYCVPCRMLFDPEPSPRLVDYPERVRRDLE